MAPWVPTRQRDMERLIGILEIKPWDRFFEIGCGDGRVSRFVASAFPKAQITWIELAYPMWWIAKLLTIFSRKKNCNIVFWNAFKQDFSQYDCIYVYGMPDKIQKKIIPKFLSEAKVGAKLYSYIFSIPEKYKKNVISFGGKDEAKIHVLEKK